MALTRVSVRPFVSLQIGADLYVEVLASGRHPLPSDPACLSWLSNVICYALYNKRKKTKQAVHLRFIVFRSELRL